MQPDVVGSSAEQDSLANDPSESRRADWAAGELALTKPRLVAPPTVASAAGGAVTGQTLFVDGGYSAT